MKELKLGAGKRALIIVAHPDDETIWMGGTILLHPDVKWTIHCLTRVSDRDREPKFRRICNIYGAESIMTDLEDDDKMSQEESVPVIKKIISSQIKTRKFDYLFTHGANGEYGHDRHIGTHFAVKELVLEKKLKCKRTFFFNYINKSKGNKPRMVAAKGTDYKLGLSKLIFHIKKRLQAEIHGYAWNGIDNSLCTNPEAFKLLK